MTKKQRERREKALERLTLQLKSGVKTAKKSSEKVPLTDKDKTRIEKDIQVLTSKLGK
jgi:hypothetical protein